MIGGFSIVFERVAVPHTFRGGKRSGNARIPATHLKRGASLVRSSGHSPNDPRGQPMDTRLDVPEQLGMILETARLGRKRQIGTRGNFAIVPPALR